MSDRHHRRRRRLIPIAEVEVDCSPATFSTPGQVRTVVSCAVTETVLVPVTQTVNMETPTSFGCTMIQPVTQTMQVPVNLTVNMPPVLTPVPQTVCPPTSPIVQGICQACGCQ